MIFLLGFHPQLKAYWIPGWHSIFSVCFSYFSERFLHVCVDKSWVKRSNTFWCIIFYLWLLITVSNHGSRWISRHAILQTDYHLILPMSVVSTQWDWMLLFHTCQVQLCWFSVSVSAASLSSLPTNYGYIYACACWYTYSCVQQITSGVLVLLLPYKCNFWRF